MDEQDWDSGGSDDLFGRDLLHVETIFQVGIDECELNDGTEERASEPRAEVKRLAHAIVGDLAKI
jgi:hypothetical protein